MPSRANLRLDEEGDTRRSFAARAVGAGAPEQNRRMQAAAALPSGTITFLFTDIEGSTRLWERSPEAMPDALARHDALLRQLIDTYGGNVFKTMGDQLCVVFAAAPDALAAALEAQRALQAETWGAVGPLRVRMALHTGEAQEQAGDYFGPAVNRVARLLAAGHGGQILLTLATREASRGQLPLGASLRDLGRHRLKDLHHPEHVFQLVPPAAPADSPPLRSLEAFAHNLPAQWTSFIGRHREMAELKQQLAATRLVTLTGAGGCGKTRLALQVAAELVEEYSDGVWLVELGALPNSELVPQTVASALGVREERDHPLSDTLVRYLRPRSLLLLLDNCEHLLTGCAHLVERLLRGCPNVRVLATSREGLRLVGEQTYRVPSLAVPDPHTLPSRERLPEFDGVRLFVDRALSSQSTFAVTEANAPAVAQVCHRLDGIPLALELAAARVRALPVETIAARLDDRFRLLTGGSRTALPRQQTLWALIDWSYDLLTEGEQTLLRRLSVFAGGWTLEAAEAVCGDCGFRILDFGSPTSPDPIQNPKAKSQNEDVLDLLTMLVEKSLVVYEVRAGAARYRLLETVQQYGRERLAEASAPPGAGSEATGPGAQGHRPDGSAEGGGMVLGTARRGVLPEGVVVARSDSPGEAEWVRRRHLEYFLRLAEEAEPKLTGPEQGAWLERLEEEHDNLRAALSGSVEVGASSSGSPEAGRVSPPGGWGPGLRLAGALCRFWLVRGYLTEGRERLAVLLAAPGASERTAARARALTGAGNMARRQGDYGAARALHEESLAIRRELGDQQDIGLSLNNLASVAYAEGDYGTARALCEESLAIKRALADKQGIASSLNSLGMVTRAQGDYGTAEALYAESLAIRRELGDRRGIAISLNGLGMVARAQGDSGAAKALCAESLALLKGLGDRPAIAECLEELAKVAGADGDAERAARLFGTAEALREAIGAPLAPVVRAEYERSAASARAALGEAAFTTAWAKGRAMTLEQAVSLALEAGPAEGARPNPD